MIQKSTPAKHLFHSKFANYKYLGILMRLPKSVTDKFISKLPQDRWITRYINIIAPFINDLTILFSKTFCFYDASMLVMRSFICACCNDNKWKWKNWRVFYYHLFGAFKIFKSIKLKIAWLDNWLKYSKISKFYILLAFQTKKLIKLKG